MALALTPLVCECPCHTLGVRHTYTCCCPHRYVVVMDCETCLGRNEDEDKPIEH